MTQKRQDEQRRSENMNDGVRTVMVSQEETRGDKMRKEETIRAKKGQDDSRRDKRDKKRQ